MVHQLTITYSRIFPNIFAFIFPLPGGAATCSEGFVVNVLKVPLACWGSNVAAIQPNSLGNSQKTFYITSQNKWPPRLVDHLTRGHWPYRPAATRAMNMSHECQHGTFDLNFEHNLQNFPRRKSYTNPPLDLTKFSKETN